jgi:ABC-type transport system involved in multi-copper enzyme maturation permease subunit
MIRPGVVWTIARAEGRLTRRLVRYWVFLAISWLAAIGGFLQYGLLLHRNFSAYGATFAMLSPRYLLGLFGPWYLLLFMLGIVFLAFDVRSRDVRERIVEVLDAKPFTNVELVLGRYVGLMMLAWIPVVVIAVFLGLLSAAVNEAIQPLSLAVFATFMAIPAMTFAVGLVFLSSILVRFRWLGALVAAVVLIGLVVAGVFMPFYATVLTDITGGFQLGWPSDLVFLESGLAGILQRFGFFAAGLGMMLLAAALYPRLDDGSRPRRLLTGGGVMVLAAAFMLGAYLDSQGYLKSAERWRVAHEARKSDPAPDLLSMSGNVQIDPGRNVSLDLALRITAPGEAPLDRALFSLNPGIAVERVTDGSGGDLQFTHEAGLLDIELRNTLSTPAELTLRVIATGAPDSTFAFIDAERNPLDVKALDGNLFLLGYEPLIFTRGFVVLLSECRWLPASGSEFGRGDPRVRPHDRFMLDLDVDLPEGWLAAGPGRRHEGEPAPDGMVAFRFSPPAPVPGAALVASRFESRSVEVDGILFEALVHPAHVDSLDFFADAADEIHDRIAQRLEDAAALGLVYPYDGFTVAEVPNSVRTFGGGWRMDTTFAPPAMGLVKESTFPTARFDVRFNDPDRFKDREGGLARAKREGIEEFFLNDFVGGNLHTAFARNFFVNQTGGKGAEGVPLDFVFETLTARLVVDQPGYFSAYLFNRDLSQLIGKVITRFAVSGGRQGPSSGVDAMVGAMTQRPEVWDAVLGASLSDLDTSEDPQRAIDVLTLKGDAMARSMLDDLGRRQVATLLAALAERHGGETFTRADLIEIAREQGLEIEQLLAVWLDETDLPGFVLKGKKVFRLSDSEDGSPRYQVMLNVLNDEAADGLVRVSYNTAEPGQAGRDSQHGETEPIRVPAGSEVEIGLVTSRTPQSVVIEPYLSLNREPFAVELAAVDEETIIREEPFRGSREVPRPEIEEDVFIVDDLDPGFSVVDVEERPWWRPGGAATDETTDQGLPILDALRFRRPPTRWSRRTHEKAFGKYRHTMAAVKAGNGECRAVWETRVPRSGPWELEVHIPWSGETIDQLAGTWNLTVEDSSGRREIPFNTGAAADGWNSLGDVEIAEGVVRVELSDKTDASLVIADAIRWSAARGNGAGGEEVASR